MFSRVLAEHSAWENPEAVAAERGRRCRRWARWLAGTRSWSPRGGWRRGRGVVAHTGQGPGSAPEHPSLGQPPRPILSPAGFWAQQGLSPGSSPPAAAVMREACGGAWVWGRIANGYCLLSP